MAITRADFPLPDLTDVRVLPYFEAAEAGRLALPRCDGCTRWVWYPADVCPQCHAAEMTWQPTSGRGRLFTWVVVRRAFIPAFEEQVPFVSALVSLEEDPRVRLVTRIVEAGPEELEPGMALRATFVPLRFPTVPDREVTVPFFVPDVSQPG